MRTAKVGDVVRLRGYKSKATVLNIMGDVEGGVWLDVPLRNFRAWNVQDLELVKRKRKAAREGGK